MALTPAEIAKAAPREARAAAHYRAKMARIHALAARGQVSAAVTTANLAEPYLQQVTEDFCGAATTAMVADYLGFGWTGHSATYQQDQAGYWVKTDGAYKDSSGTIHFPNGDGTGWYGADNVPSYPDSSYYPIQDWLNYKIYQRRGVSWYLPAPLPSSPSAQQQSDLVTHLVADIDASYPEADNQWSARGYELPYQPAGAWQHWWSARGYRDSGQTTGINDPAGWSHGAEHWVTTRGGAHTVVIALGYRGYIW